MVSVMYLKALSTEEKSALLKGHHEDPKQTTKDLASIKQWIAKQPHLPQDIGDNFLLCLLRQCKYSFEKFKTKLDNNFTARGALPEIFHDRDPLDPSLQAERKKLCSMPLPQLTPDGYRVIFKTFTKDPADFSFDTMCKNTAMGLDLLYEADSFRRGFIVVCDASNFTVGHSVRVPLGQVKKILTLLYECFPDRLKYIVAVNVNPAMSNVINIIKSFVPEKLAEKVRIFGDNYKGLYDLVPKEYLPLEVGGDAGPMEELNDMWYKELIKNKEWIKDMGNKITDESKRIGKPNNYDDLFGMEGSFRALSID